MARTDFEPLTWEEAEQNRHETLLEHFAGIPTEDLSLATLMRAPQSGPAPTAAKPMGESRPEQYERLRAEIKRGREYLAQAEKELAEDRAQLEGWPAYERICGQNPLNHLTRSVLIKERITQFLADWLERREAEISARASREQAPAPIQLPASVRGFRRPSASRKTALQRHRTPKARLVA